MLNPNIQKIIDEVKTATIVAATKYVQSDTIRLLYPLGIHHLGENIVDAFLEKYESLKDIGFTWHFIGHLQTNKVKKMIDKIDYLHSLDRISLADSIQKYRTHVLNCFVEVNISLEINKTGIDPKEVQSFIEIIKNYDKIHVVGLMGMAENTDNIELIHQQFNTLKTLRDQIQAKQYDNAPCMYLSMGMSNDYKIALSEGSTHLRLGSVLFKKEE